MRRNLGWTLLILLIASAALYQLTLWLAPPPPRSIIFAAGEAGGTYAAAAERIKNAAKKSVAVNIIQSNGSINNLELLRSGRADAAFVQSGLALESDPEQLQTLGGMFHEPVWLFTGKSSSDAHQISLNALKGQTIAIGPEGSGSGRISLLLLAANGVNQQNSELLAMPSRRAVAALRQGEVDNAIFVTSPKTTYIRELLNLNQFNLFSLKRATAYTRIFPYLAQVTLPEGSISLERNIPAQDIELIAPAAQLVVRKDLHPAVQALLTEKADLIFEPGGLLHNADYFPSHAQIDLPLADEARRYYERGPTFLRRYFSFGVSNFLERAWIFLIPFIVGGFAGVFISGTVTCGIWSVSLVVKLIRKSEKPLKINYTRCK